MRALRNPLCDTYVCTFSIADGWFLDTFELAYPVHSKGE